MNQAAFPATSIRPLSGSRGGTLQNLFPNETIRIALFFLVHIVLGLMMSAFREVATAHAIITVAVGLWLGVSSPRQEQVVWTVAYITGAEVLWRMTQAQIFWEFGKYAVAAVLLITIIRRGMFRNVALPFMYFALLLPSAVLPTINMATSELRGQLSFNLSGPFSLAVCIWYFSQLRLPSAALHRAFLFLIAPVVAMCSVTLTGLLSAGKIRFGRESNFLASGGFGPNQVSAMLGMAILCALLYLLVEKRSSGLKLLIFTVMIILSIQSALTFSRTGLYSALAAGMVSVFYLIRDSRTRVKIFGIVFSCFLLANFVILPKLDEFTGGTILARFQNTSSTGRADIIKADLMIWGANPIFGVGPGRAFSYRAIAYRASAAHTEFSRLVAEHGMFGLCALILLLMIGLQNLRRARSNHAKALAVPLTFWGFIFMLVSAMRLAAPSVAIGLGAIMLIEDEEEFPQVPSPDLHPPYLPWRSPFPERRFPSR